MKNSEKLALTLEECLIQLTDEKLQDEIERALVLLDSDPEIRSTMENPPPVFYMVGFERRIAGLYVKEADAEYHKWHLNNRGLSPVTGPTVTPVMLHNIRLCLRCDKNMPSYGSGERKCWHCKESDASGRRKERAND